MTIATICRSEVITIDAGASLQDAANLMRAHHIGALVVTVDAAGGEPAVAVITDRDLAIEVLTCDLNPTDVKVGQLASRHLASVPGTANIADAVAVMQAAGVRRLLVTGNERQLTGFVSADDLLGALAEQLGILANALRTGIAREGAKRASIPRGRPRPVFLPHRTPGMHQSISPRASR